ncbi:MAG: class F sortase [Actinomycetota bacterium]|nr:class F sortase [Actinomycetota bacterium]
MRRLLVALTGVTGAALLVYAVIGSPATPATAPAPRSGAVSPEPIDARTERERPPARQAATRDDSAPASAAAPERPEGPWLEIEAIGVSAPLVSLGLNPDRSLQVPGDAASAGWWRGGPEPGERGASVIAGHVDSRNGPAVFYRLRALRPGAAIEVTTEEGTTARFVVERTERYAKDRFPTRRVYGRTRGSTLRLVTCAGSFDAARGHYRDNLVVFARRGG